MKPIQVEPSKKPYPGPPLKQSIKTVGLVVQSDEEFKLEYVDVIKMKCIVKQIYVSKRNIDTIIETCLDYADMLEKVIPTIERPYTKLVYENKVKELKSISSKLIEETGYCKDCKDKKQNDDIGLDPLEILANRKKV